MGIIPLKTIEKTFRLLEILAEKQPAKAPELVQESRFPRSNLYRILSTLRQMGYVNRTDSRYVIGSKVFVMANALQSINRLITVARPYMVRMSEISEETVNLAVMHEGKVLYIDKIESSHYLD